MRLPVGKQIRPIVFAGSGGNQITKSTYVTMGSSTDHSGESVLIGERVYSDSDDKNRMVLWFPEPITFKEDFLISWDCDGEVVIEQWDAYNVPTPSDPAFVTGSLAVFFITNFQGLEPDTITWADIHTGGILEGNGPNTSGFFPANLLLKSGGASHLSALDRNPGDGGEVRANGKYAASWDVGATPITAYGLFTITTLGYWANITGGSIYSKFTVQKDAGIFFNYTPGD